VSGEGAEELWRFGNDDTFACQNETSEEQRDLRGIYGKPLVAEGMVYFGAYDGNVYALDAASGTCVWVFEGTDGPIIGGVALAEEAEILYVGSDDGNLYGLDPANGNLKIGPFDAGDAIWTTPLIVEDRMYFTTVGGRVWARTARDLHPIPTWEDRFKTGAGLITDPIIVGEGDDAVLVVGGIGEKLFGLDPATGEEVWARPFKGGNWFWGRPALDGDTLYYPNLDHKVYAVNGTTGEPVWERPFAADEAIRAAPVLAGDVLAVIDRKGNVFSVDPATGERLLATATNLGQKVLADPVVHETEVLVLTDNGRILAFDPNENGFRRVVVQ
jgi:outer membrane protein assembly factor BamB